MLNKGNNATDLIESGRARICVFMRVRVFFWEGGGEEMCSRPPTVTNRELQEFHQLSHNSDMFTQASECWMSCYCHMLHNPLTSSCLSSLFHHIQVSVQQLSVEVDNY